MTTPETTMKLVLLPGLDGTGLLFAPLLRAFSAGLEPCVVDYPSDRITNYAELAEQIRPLLPSEPFVLLGESYGGPLSLILAASAPPGLRGLILSASFVTCPHSYVPTWAAPLVIPPLFLAAPLMARMKARFGGYATEELTRLITESQARVANRVLAARVREVVRVDVRTELEACPVPILYLQGSRDLVVPAGNPERISKLRPDLQVEVFDSPHMILQTQPSAAAQAIESFMTLRCQAQLSR